MSISIETIVQEIKACSGNISMAARHLEISRDTIYDNLLSNHIDLAHLRFNEDYFEIIDSEDKAYFLGYLFADGCVCVEKNRVDFAIHIKDSYILDIFKEKLSSVNNIRKYNEINVAIINHTSKKLVHDLKFHGCTERKSLTLAFPTTINNNYLWDFIRGYFDGDGCVTGHLNKKKENSNRIRLSFIGTEKFLTSLQTIFNTTYKLRLTGNNKVIYCLEITSKKNLDFIISNMYKNATIFLERKKNKCASHL